jgi:hypothetical protein
MKRKEKGNWAIHREKTSTTGTDSTNTRREREAGPSSAHFSKSFIAIAVWPEPNAIWK